MTTQAEHDLLTQTGRGTPCGELLRRYWQPVALSEELLADKPLPVTIFGEELIMFRDGAARPALIGRYCAHQGVDMIYGCVEPDGLRCMYHGWLFDNCGKVVMRGDWLPEKERRWDVGQPAYPCVEQSGVIFTYMATGDPPPPPILECLGNSFEGSAPAKDMREENFLRGLIDGDESPFNSAAFVLPNLLITAPPSADGPNWLRWHVPVDDKSHAVFTIRNSDSSAFNGESRAALHRILLNAIDAVRPKPSISAVESGKD